MNIASGLKPDAMFKSHSSTVIILTYFKHYQTKYPIHTEESTLQKQHFLESLKIKNLTKFDKTNPLEDH